MRTLRPPIALLLTLVVVHTGCHPTNLTVIDDDTSNSPDAAISTDNGAADNAASRTRRKFGFTYGVTLTEIEPSTPVNVWIPVATNRHEQQITITDIQLPADHTETTEKRFGNKLIYFTAKANADGEVPIRIEYLVDRAELNIDDAEQATGADNERYLAANQKIPVDAALRTTILGSETPQGTPTVVARSLYEAVDTRMRYDKPADKPGWGNGDAAWACGNGFGNCTDFHSLFISAARNLKIPARFEIGFMIPPLGDKPQSGSVGGYHCWAKFLSDGSWLPVDISEADKHPEKKEYYFGNIGADRVTFTTGRDLELDPPNAAGPVNYLVYPYAEIDGKQHKSFRKEFRYKDI